MTITIQPQIPVIIALTIIIVGILKYINTKLVKFDPLSEPTALITVCILLVEYIDQLVVEITNKKIGEKLAPYICSISIYILISNYIGLLGFENPTKNWSVTLSIALVTFVLIQKTDIDCNGVGSYIHAFFEPIFLFVVPNFFGTVAPLLSMSLRLFGNILSGSIIMELVYNAGNIVSNLFWSIFGLKDVFNFIGPIIAAPLHCYFDLFAGFIQTYIFIMLSAAFIGNKIPDEQRD
ncbi:MAG: F0F1 ATP synthase subunit A [Erysipelotrichaceae bacterium]|nr:F0F1 ATP synthase subunit A [Erysipelotrichaceae bacterium]